MISEYGAEVARALNADLLVLQNAEAKRAALQAAAVAALPPVSPPPQGDYESTKQFLPQPYCMLLSVS
jgi:hypothetical protein